MKLSEISNLVDKRITGLLSSSFDELRPCQEKAIKAGLLDGKSLLVCSPTASGKTFVAELAILNKLISQGGKAVYIVPLKSLAVEKYKEFNEKYGSLGLKIAISIGDLDKTDTWLQNYDIIITTSEKLDSLIRHGVSWIRDIKVVVIDEIHLLNDAERGPTLEILITLLKALLQNSQTIALSATIGNPQELSKWLNAGLVEDSWRPVKLYEGVFSENQIDFFKNKENICVNNIDEPAISLALDTIKINKQALIFCASKSSAEATAEKISKKLKSEDPELGKAILSAISAPTKQCRRLAGCISKSIAFHHAGLTHKQKEIIEDNFRKNKVKIICCTPTLAAGVNLPAYRAIIRSLKRFSDNWGNSWIPVLEYKQMSGRAGRPGLEDSGEAICLANSDDEKSQIHSNYILGEVEDIYSKLAVEPVLRTAILSLISSGFIRTREKLIEFFENTFYGYQYGNDFRLHAKLGDMLALLKGFGFVSEAENRLMPTPLGKRVSELYLDPLTANQLIEGAKLAEKIETVPFSYLHLISNTLEMRPHPSVRGKDAEELQSVQLLHNEFLLSRLPNEWDFNYDEFQSSFKTAVILNSWANEVDEENLLEKYNVRPGEMQIKLQNADWLLYSYQELCRILGYKNQISPTIKLRMRVKYGIKEELLPLVKIKGIGRKRARKLFNSGLKTIRELKTASPEQLSQLVGQKTAEKIISQLSYPSSED